MHSWYKHLPINPIEFIFLKRVGQQSRNNIHQEYTDNNMSNVHWHWYKLSGCSKNFLKTLIETNQPIYVAKFGGFLRGLELIDSNFNYTHGFKIIGSGYCSNKIDKFTYLLEKYPEYNKPLTDIKNNPEKEFDYKNIISDIFIREQTKYLIEVLQLKLWQSNV